VVGIRGGIIVVAGGGTKDVEELSLELIEEAYDHGFDRINSQGWIIHSQE
jgi:hypothetical protein